MASLQRGKQVTPLTGTDRSLADAATRSLPTSIEKRAGRQLVDKSTSALAHRLGVIRDEVRAKKVSPDVAKSRAREAIARGIGIGAGVGVALAGLPDWKLTAAQRRDLADLADTEAEYFHQYMRQVIGEAAGDARADLYGGVVGDAMWRTWAQVLPHSAEVNWRLGVAEHCADCLSLADGSPYSAPGATGPNPLPTVPRNGDTICLGNCRCYLESAGPFESGAGPDIQAEITAIAGVEIDPASPAATAAAGAYQDLVERYAYFLRMDALDPKAGYAALMALADRQISDLARAHGQTVRIAATDAEIIEPALMAVAIGLRFVKPTSVGFDLVGLVAVALGMHEIKMGAITGYSRTPPTVRVKKDDLRLDSVGRNILFVDERARGVSGRNDIRIEVLEINSQSVNPEDPKAVAAAVKYQDLAEQYAYFLRLDTADPVAGYAVQLAEVERQIMSIASRERQVVRMAPSAGEIVRPVETAKNENKRFVRPTLDSVTGAPGVSGLTNDLIGRTALAIGISETDKGKITAITHLPPSVTFGKKPGRVYRLDKTGRFILYVE